MNFEIRNKEKLLNIVFYSILVIIILTGLYVRFALYSKAYPLWIDEVALNTSIVTRDFSGCFKYLDYEQMAAPLFTGICILVWKAGRSFFYFPFVLHFVPFICGCISLFAFYYLCKCFFKTKYAVILAMTVFSFCAL